MKVDVLFLMKLEQIGQVEKCINLCSILMFITNFHLKNNFTF